MRVSASQVRYFRLRRSGLAEPFHTPEAAASALVGVQAQILPAAGLALWNRTSGLTYAALDRLLHGQRSLVKLLGQRSTLHLYASDEWPLIHSALQGQYTWWQRLGEETAGGSEKYRAAVVRVAQLLRERGTLGRSELRASGLELGDALFSSWGGIFASLVREGYACHAGQAGNEGRFAHREYWLPDLRWDPPPGDQANVELTRRYLRAYGPACARDLIYWRGARAADARRWLAALGDEVTEVNVSGQTALALRADLDALNARPP